MGVSKTESFTEPQVNLANFAKALAHPARIAIVEYLLARNSCVCGDIVDSLPLAQSTVSQHLKELKNVGLIQGNIDGKNICYCIDYDVWNKMTASMNELYSKANFRINNCC